METDKHYFTVGLFIIGIFAAAMAFSIWLSGSGQRDDIRYRIKFADSVTGLSVGDVVKFRGVNVGTVESIEIDPDDYRLVRVDVKLRKDAPITTDTNASLRLKGITGVVFVELTSGDDPNAQNLIAATQAGEVPEIPAEASSLGAVMDQLPKTLKKIDKIAEQTTKMMSDKNIAAFSDMLGQMRAASHNANELSKSLKDDPSQLIWSRSKKKPEVPNENR